MFNKIAAIQPYTAFELLVWFADGEARLFNVLDYARTHEEFATLEDEKLAGMATLAAEGYGISWGESLDLGCKEVFEASEPVGIVDAEGRRIIKQIIEARHTEGLSQARLAAAANVKQPVIARLETGVNSPRLDTILKVLTPLGKTLRVIDLRGE